MPIPVLRDRKRARDTLRVAKTNGTKDKLLQNVTKDAIEKAHKKGDLDAKFRAVENAAALEAVEEQQRDAAAAGEDLSTKDATAAFLVAQEQGKDAQEVQQRHNAAEDQLIRYAEQCREIGTKRRCAHGGSYFADGDKVQQQQADWAAHREKICSRGETEEARYAVPDTHHSLDTHGAWVADIRANRNAENRKWQKSVEEQLQEMDIQRPFWPVEVVVEGGSIAGFKVDPSFLPSWEGVENPVTSFEKATANAARIRREIPGAARRQSEITEEREKAGKPRNCYPQRNGKWNVEFYVGGRKRQIRDLKTGEHLLEKDAARDLRDEYEKHVAEGRNGKCPCQCNWKKKKVCPWLVPIKPKKRRCS